jgi:hypothetical protein
MAQAFEDGSFPGPQVSSRLQSLTDRRVNVATTPPNQALHRTGGTAGHLNVVSRIEGRCGSPPAAELRALGSFVKSTLLEDRVLLELSHAGFHQLLSRKQGLC